MTKVKIYHTNWAQYARAHYPKDLDIDGLDICYAFFNVGEDGKVFSGDEWADFQNPLVGKGVDPQNKWDSPAQSLGSLGQFTKLKEQGKKFNLHLAIGGWTWSKNFSLAVRTEESRRNFVHSVTALFKQWPVFTGVCLDWEYVSAEGVNFGNEGNSCHPDDFANLILLLKSLRKELPDKTTIGMCLVADIKKVNWDVRKIEPLVDQFDIMTYDFADGAWGNTVAQHHTNLRSTETSPASVEKSVADWLSKGIPASKLLIGVAYYSRGFANTAGIGQAASGASPDKSWEAGCVDYKDLPKQGSVEMWDEKAQAVYSYDAKRKVLNSYDDPRSVKAKCEFVKKKGLAGIIVWESSGDKPKSDPRCLTTILKKELLKK